MMPLADLAGLLPIVLIATAVIGVLAATARPKTRFEIEIVDGVPSIASGDPPSGFVEDIDRICQLWKIETGVVRGLQAGSHTEIVVKGEAAQHTQAFLNAWRNPI